MTVVTELPQHTWAVENPVPSSGEICVDSDTGRCKQGDGVRPWTALPYHGDEAPQDVTVLNGGEM